jgi:ATP-dependent exoDNAse (exonuclease V) alpha subunit
MRQAEGDPIVTISHKLINGERLEFGKYGDNVLVIPYENINEQLLTSADVLLASRNRTRDDINNTIRYDINKRENADPTIGDKVICRQNDWGLSLYEDGTEISLVNGMSGSITNVYKETYLKNTIEIDFQPDFTKGCFEHLEINHGYYTGNFEQRANIKSSFKPAGHLVEQGDCITVHLSQGSEYPFVCYFLENYGWNRRFMNQLHYTAATRAQNKLVIVQ